MHGTRRTWATQIVFTLSAPSRVLFLVRGPAPSCRLAGRFRIRGHRGLNRIRFTGRIGRRRLSSGAYRLTARTPGRRAARPIVVLVGGGQKPDRFRCGPAADGPSFAVSAGRDTGASSFRPATRKPGVPNESDVLPAVRGRLRALPGVLPRRTDLPNQLLGIGALVLLAFSAAGLAVSVVRVIRGPRAN